MAKAGPILETMLARVLPGDMGMKSRLPLQDEPGTGTARAVSVFGHGQVAAQIDVPELLGHDLRSAMLRHDPERLWADLAPMSLSPAQAEAGLLIPNHDNDAVGLLFDHLRTRLLQALKDNGWSRVAVVAPSRGCGASLVAANLALSLARRPSGRVVLIDLDLRGPSLASLFGVEAPGALRDVMTGEQPMEAHFLRLGRTLALGLNGQAETASAELLQEPSTVDALAAVLEDLSPDVVLYDLPPMLDSDDVLAFLPQVDGVLLVADGTRSTAAEIRECERLLAEQTKIIGVVLNRAEDSPAKPGRRR